MVNCHFVLARWLAAKYDQAPYVLPDSPFYPCGGSPLSYMFGTTFSFVLVLCITVCIAWVGGQLLYFRGSSVLSKLDPVVVNWLMLGWFGVPRHIQGHLMVHGRLWWELSRGVVALGRRGCRG